jgi:hypothetical protein
MEKYIMRWSYWLGIACVVLALVLRALNAIGLHVAEIATRGNSVGYHSFLRGAALFLGTAIATACFTWFNKQST